MIQNILEDNWYNNFDINNFTSEVELFILVLLY